MDDTDDDADFTSFLVTYYEVSVAHEEKEERERGRESVFAYDFDVQLKVTKSDEANPQDSRKESCCCCC